MAWDGEADARMDAEQREVEEAELASTLVQRIRQGDSSAETELVERYGERLRYVLYRQMSQYPHDVDDVVQEALTATLIRLRQDGIDDPARLGGFIYGIAKNLRLARIRDHARHDGDTDPEVISHIPTEEIRPDQIVAGRETTRIVRQLLAELGNSRGRERDREVLLRLYIRQESREEVCEALDIDPDHLRRVIHRAKQRLKILLVESIDREALGQVSHD
jgi:RNA polymerase sigma-70 factor (ECF subfamily)